MRDSVDLGVVGLRAERELTAFTLVTRPSVVKRMRVAALAFVAQSTNGSMTR